MAKADSSRKVPLTENDEGCARNGPAADADDRAILSNHDLAVKSQQGPFLIHKGQPITYHPLAARVPRNEEHRARLRASLEAKGQMEPIKVLLVDGQPEVVDGVTRTEELFAIDRPVLASLLTETERHGLSVPSWIVAKNLSASEGRQLNVVQRALLAARAFEEINEIEKAAENRKTSGRPVSDDERGSTQDFLAKLAGVTGNRIRDARDVASHDDLHDAAWNGDLPLSTAAKIATLPSKRSRKRALNAAKEKDRDLLRDILSGTSPRADAAKQEHSPIAKATIPATKDWPKKVNCLRQVIDWIEGMADKPESRVLAATVSTDTLREVIEKIQSSRPYAPCPFCQDASGKKCECCTGSGWLTQGEYQQAEAQLVADSIEQIEDGISRKK